MRVTEINLKPTTLQKGDQGVLAYVSVVFDRQLAVKGMRLVRTVDKILVSMPSREKTEKCHNCDMNNSVSNRFCVRCGKSLDFQDDDKHHLDLCHPITSDLRQHLEDEVKREYVRKTGYEL